VWVWMAWHGTARHGVAWRGMALVRMGWEWVDLGGIWGLGLVELGGGGRLGIEWVGWDG
jgi:hypothetical protein